jgi:hypothetical protein
MEPEPFSFYDIWIRTETTVREVAENTVGYTRKQARNEWFDEECARVNEKKNAAMVRAFGVKTKNA